MIKIANSCLTLHLSQQRHKQILQLSYQTKKMKNVLIIGSTGQIGSELTMKLRSIYGSNNVIAGYIPGAEPKGELAESGPAEIVDITNAQQIADAVEKYKIDTI